jgi:putative drug exporter of the RND superfamily
MHRVLTFSAHPRGKWIVFLAWIVAIGVTLGTGLPERFTDAEENESTSFLPESAESTEALRITEQLQDGELAPTVVVYRRDGGLRPADRREIDRDIAELNEVTARYENTTPFELGEVSRDGTTALVVNQIRGTGEGEDIIDPVEDYRDTVSADGQAPEGLQVKVAGPSGISADAIKVFENINSTLILAALTLVIVLLILIYRSPIFWFFPILAVIFAELLARAFGVGLNELGVTINGQSSSIMSVLVIGAGTDYALLLVARYREELRRHQDKHEAMELALRRAGPAILASGGTVAIALLSLTLAKVNGTAGLGPIGAMGIAVALLSMLTFLPAVLTIVGRRRFWPFVPYGPDGPGAADHTPLRAPRVGPFGPALLPFTALAVLVAAATVASAPVVAAVVVALVALFALRGRWIDEHYLRPIERNLSARAHEVDETHGFWRRVGDRVARRPRAVGAAGLLLLAIMSLGLLNFSTGLTSANAFRDTVESVEGQELVAQAFPQGQAAPTDIVVRDPAQVEAAVRAAAQVEGVAAVTPEPVAEGPPGTLVQAFLEFDPYSTDAYDVIPPLRAAVREAAPSAVVGGPSAVERDLRDASADDTILLIPIALAIVFVILVLLLRSILAPVLLIATVVLSFLAALGVGAVVFDVIFGFPGSDPSIPLFAFIFLVALGVDYNIFLMARVREETLKHGTREGMLRGLAVTGGVITSAGIVLAGTFAVLGVLPLAFLTQIGFVIAFGVLLDTFVVRSILVPALVFDIGPKVWWPSSLASSLHRRRGRGGPPRGSAGSDRAPSG